MAQQLTTAAENEIWAKAISDVKGGLSLRKAAAKYGIKSHESLRRRVQSGTPPEKVKMGPKIRYLSVGHEEGILEMITYRAKMGMCMSESELRYYIRHAALDHALKTNRPVSPDFPNRKFVQRFVKRHEAISYRRAQILEVKRAECSTEETVLKYFDMLQEVIAPFLSTPESIWNCDETGVCPQGRAKQRVICPKGLRANIQRSSERENVSIMGCCNAAGGHIPPMYIFAGKRMKVEWMEGSIQGSKCAMSDSANINDVGVYGAFKSCYEKALARYPLDNEGAHPTKDDLVQITSRPFQTAFSAHNCASGFRKCGIYPLDVNVMLQNIVGSAPAAMRDNLRHHSSLLAHDYALQISEHQRRLLERSGLDIDALNVVNFGLRKMVKGESKKRKSGTFCDPSEGAGFLLTHAEMLAELKRKLEEKKKKAKHASARKVVAQEKKVEADAKKKAAKIAKREKEERFKMNLEDRVRHQTARTKKMLKDGMKIAKREKEERFGMNLEDKVRHQTARTKKLLKAAVPATAPDVPDVIDGEEIGFYV